LLKIDFERQGSYIYLFLRHDAQRSGLSAALVFCDSSARTVAE